MKRILLTSTALVMTAGIAAAEVSFSGDAEIGYNDDFNNGVFWSMGLSLSASKDLDNGLTASISGDITMGNGAITFTDANNDGVITDTELSATSGNNTLTGGNVAIDDLVIALKSDTASLTFGDTAPAADVLYSDTTNLDYDGFSDEGDNSEDAVLIGRMTFGSTEVGLSYAIDDANSAPNDNDLAQLQVGVAGSAGSVSYTLGYQSTEGTDDSIMAASVSTSFGGADVKLAYASEDNQGSGLGLSVSYPVGDVTVSAFYAMHDADTGTGTNEDNYGIGVDYASGPLTLSALFHDGGDEDMQINATYDMGNGLALFGGYRDNGSSDYTASYVGGDYDLGGDANLRVSYADVTTAAGGTAPTLDELGKAEDVKEGLTVALSLKF